MSAPPPPPQPRVLSLARAELVHIIPYSWGVFKKLITPNTNVAQLI